METSNIEVLVNHIKWEKVAYLPKETRLEVEAELTKQGFLLIHSPLGSAYVSNSNRMHPDYKLSQAFLDDVREEQELAEKEKTLKHDILAFLNSTKVNSFQGSELIGRACQIIGGSNSEQSFLIQYFSRTFAIGYTEQAVYGLFRKFCRIADFEVNNNALDNFSHLHSDWYEKEKERIRNEAITSTLDEAIEGGCRSVAIGILQRDRNVDYHTAAALVENMIKIRDLKAKASGLWPKSIKSAIDPNDIPF